MSTGSDGAVVHVVAGVIRDPRGRVLLARRTRGRDLAGLWEFPGGKLEPGESPRQALVRELREELGIEARIGEPLIDVPQQYPDKRLRLDVFMVSSWRGRVRGLDGQALAWVPPPKLVRYPMPPADRPVVAALLRPDRYLITPTPAFETRGKDDDVDASWLQQLQAALDAGVRLVQLRAPGLASQHWRALAAQAVDACRQVGAEVLINADAQLAQQLGVGLHLRSAQLAAQAAGVGAQTRESTDAQATEAEQTRPLLAASCHDLTQLRQAEAAGCDFVVLGPVAATASHPGVAGIGWDGFARLREQVSLPIYALGGMQVGDIASARAHGAQGIAAIRGLWPPPSDAVAGR